MVKYLGPYDLWQTSFLGYLPEFNQNISLYPEKAACVQCVYLISCVVIIISDSLLKLSISIVLAIHKKGQNFASTVAPSIPESAVLCSISPGHTFFSSQHYSKLGRDYESKSNPGRIQTSKTVQQRNTLEIHYILYRKGIYKNYKKDLFLPVLVASKAKGHLPQGVLLDIRRCSETVCSLHTLRQSVDEETLHVMESC